MEDLFRFVLARPAQSEPDEPVVEAEPSEGLDREVRDARDSDDPRKTTQEIAERWQASGRTMHSLSDLRLHEQLSKIKAALEDRKDRTLEELQEIVETALGPAGEGHGERELDEDSRRLGDIILVNAIAGRDPDVRSSDAVEFLRVIALARRVRNQDESLARPGGIERALSAPVVLPPGIFPLPAAKPARGGGNDGGNKDEERRRNLVDRQAKLLAAYDALTHVRAEHFETARTRVLTSITERVALAGEEDRAVTAASAPRARAAGREAGGDFTALEHRTPGPSLLLRADALQALPGEQRNILKERRLDPTEIGVPAVVDMLALEIRSIGNELTTLSAPAKPLIKVGSSYYDPGVGFADPNISGYFANVGVPSSHGSLAPAGIGDLLVVRQVLKRYEGRELAHVENVLLGEYKERVHRRARTTEETFTVETELKKEEERDQQTTERFELKTEASRIQKEDTSFKIGAALSGKYGPVVEFKLSTDFAMNSSKEEASKIATSYSKDVVQRASSKVFEKRREERILKTIEVFEETNTHGIDNKTGTGHVVGQYQWIDKVYEAQVYNYGKRLLFDLMVPEPAAFLLHATGAQPKAGAELRKPKPFTKKPTEIDEWNYAQLVVDYEVVGVTSPPQPYVTISKVLEGEGKQDGGTTKSVEIPIPNGFWAVDYEWVSQYWHWNGGVDIAVVPEPYDQVMGAVTVALLTRKCGAYEVSVAVHCARTDQALLDWKLKTHSAILQAYQKQLRDYEDKLAALEVQAAQKFEGRNPLENDLLIRAELKKGAISIFTAQHFDMFGAITNSSQGYPQADLPEAEVEGKYIRFFEQAFEWEQMMYFFYPYYWGRKANWLKRALLQDTDPVFAEFLKSGAARVTLAVRPGFEKAVLHFLSTGETWDGGDLPPVTSPLYVSIIKEIQERDKAPGAEVPQGDPWDVRLPTTLVILRDEAKLPAWKKDPSGEWVPA